MTQQMPQAEQQNTDARAVAGVVEQDESGVVQRAYAILQVKSMLEDERIIRGMATTPSTDRVGDVIEPLGVQFKNPMPCLWQHDNTKPIGTVTFETPMRSGIKFEAKLPKVTEPGLLKDRVDEAWQSVKYGLVAGASIGFRPLKDGYELMDDGGIKFKSIQCLEMSLVTIPANQDCTISTIKSLDLAPSESVQLSATMAREASLPVVYLNDRVEQKRRIAKPNSKAAPDGSRYSVRIIRAK
jgi:HK97 family phage prohead protease